LNAHAERYVKSMKEECLSRIILFGEEGLRRTLNEFVAHCHEERNHQRKGNLLLFPSADLSSPPGSNAIECKQRLGGMLKYYYREAA
jgi:hypothetical protein